MSLDEIPSLNGKTATEIPPQIWGMIVASLVNRLVPPEDGEIFIASRELDAQLGKDLNIEANALGVKISLAQTS